MLSFRCCEGKAELLKEQILARNLGPTFHCQIAFIQIKSHAAAVDFDNGNYPSICPFFDGFRMDAVPDSDFLLGDELCTHHLISPSRDG
jgi:hypothetical protein